MEYIIVPLIITAIILVLLHWVSYKDFDEHCEISLVENRLAELRREYLKAMANLNKVRVEEQKVSCQSCKCLIYLANAYSVKQEGWIDLHYCQKCKPNYTKIINKQYYKELQVDINGEPIEYKKK